MIFSFKFTPEDVTQAGITSVSKVYMKVSLVLITTEELH